MNVVLIHGLARTSFSLLSLERYLRNAGHVTEQFGYLAFAETFDQIVERLRSRLRPLAQQQPYSIVCHSLGGLLTRAALGPRDIAPPAHLVMLGTPNQKPRLAPLAWHLPPFQWFTGQCGFNLANSAFFESLPGVDWPYTIIAGTGGPRGWLSPFGDEVNDGIVALSETRLTPNDPLIQLPVMHTFMMNHRAVQAAALKAIQGESAAAIA